ncbi:winged helix-turn-helix domain-containing protein [Streptomyces niveus]|uniref:AfsR/SARP family transcriptional regulator n=1 Tax=Streptomyces niveus TaxID=193462 RepID=UPI0036EC0B30
MRIFLLGPVRARTDDATPIDVGGVRLHMLLARLALDAGRPVPVHALVDGLWGEEPPAEAANAVQALVSRLRKALRSADGGGLIDSVAGGYRLAVRADDVDAYRFEVLAARGRRDLVAGRLEEAATVLGTVRRSPTYGTLPSPLLQPPDWKRYGTRRRRTVSTRSCGPAGTPRCWPTWRRRARNAN